MALIITTSAITCKGHFVMAVMRIVHLMCVWCWSTFDAYRKYFFANRDLFMPLLLIELFFVSFCSRVGLRLGVAFIHIQYPIPFRERVPAHVTRYPCERHLPEKRHKNRGDRTEGQLSIGNFNCHNNLACFANTLNLLYINCLEDAGAGCNAGYNNLAMK